MNSDELNVPFREFVEVFEPLKRMGKSAFTFADALDSRQDR
jgi:hypothetical protein